MSGFILLPSNCRQDDMDDADLAQEIKRLEVQAAELEAGNRTLREDISRLHRQLARARQSAETFALSSIMLGACMFEPLLDLAAVAMA